MEDVSCSRAFVYLAAAVISVPIAKRLGLGSVLGYLLAGVAIGPFGARAGRATEGQDVMHFAEFGVVMMLFLVGLSCGPRCCGSCAGRSSASAGCRWSSRPRSSPALALALGLAWQTALAVGMILAMSSTAIVLQTPERERACSRPPAGQAAFSVLLFQDIAVIPILAFLPLLARSAARRSRAASHGRRLIAQAAGLGSGAAGARRGGGASSLAGRFVVRPAVPLPRRHRGCARCSPPRRCCSSSASRC